MKRLASSLTGTVALVLLVATLASGQGQGQGQGGGRGGGGGGSEDPAPVGQLTIHDDFDAGGTSPHRLLSDLGRRVDEFGLPLADADADGFADLTTVPLGGLPDQWPSTVYQDRRLVPDSMLPELVPADPCVAIDIPEGGGSSTGTVNADLDRGSGDAFSNCAVFEEPGGNQPFLDDARTFTFVFPAGGVCDHFSYLADSPSTYGWPAGSEWGTGFEQGTPADDCRVTPAAGAILTDDETRLTGNPRMSGRFFGQSKVKGKTVGATGTRVNLVFTADQKWSGVPDPVSVYNVRSIDEDVAIEWVPTFPSDEVEITANDQLFQLVEFSGNEPVVPDVFTLPLRVTVRRYPQ